MDKILFLDIDGVILPNRAAYLPNQTPLWTVFDPCAVHMINHICKVTSAKIAIHSSWVRAQALVSANCVPSVDTVKDHMVNQGINADYFHVDAHCYYRFSGTRWNAIYDWLCDHNTVTRWVALDDELCPFPDGLLTDFDGGKIINTDPDVGINLDNMDSTILHLGRV
jgi:hypothetical protein